MQIHEIVEQLHLLRYPVTAADLKSHLQAELNLPPEAPLIAKIDEAIAQPSEKGGLSFSSPEAIESFAKEELIGDVDLDALVSAESPEDEAPSPEMEAFFSDLSEHSGPISVSHVRDGMVEDLEIPPDDGAIREMDEILEQDQDAAFESFLSLQELLHRHNYRGLPPLPEAEPKLEANVASATRSHTTGSNPKTPDTATTDTASGARSDQDRPAHSATGTPAPESEMTPRELQQRAKSHGGGANVYMRQGLLSSAGDLLRTTNPFSAMNRNWLGKEAPDYYERIGMETKGLADLQLSGLQACCTQIRTGLAALSSTDKPEVRDAVRTMLGEQATQLVRRAKDMRTDVDAGRYEEQATEEISNVLNDANNLAHEVLESDALEDDSLKEQLKRQMQEIMEFVSAMVSRMLGRDQGSPAPA